MPNHPTYLGHSRKHAGHGPSPRLRDIPPGRMVRPRGFVRQEKHPKLFSLFAKTYKKNNAMLAAPIYFRWCPMRARIRAYPLSSGPQIFVARILLSSCSGAENAARTGPHLGM